MCVLREIAKASVTGTCQRRRRRGERLRRRRRRLSALRPDSGHVARCVHCCYQSAGSCDDVCGKSCKGITGVRAVIKKQHADAMEPRTDRPGEKNTRKKCIRLRCASELIIFADIIFALCNYHGKIIK